MGIPLSWFIIIQIALNLFSALLLYKIGCALTPSKWVGVFAALIYLFCYPIQEWVLALYTESLFINLIIFYAYCIHVLRGKKMLLFGFLLALLLTFQRPVGILIAVAGSYTFLIEIFAIRIKTAFAITTSLLALLFILGFFIPVSCADVAVPVYRGTVIFPKWNDEDHFNPPCTLYKTYAAMIQKRGVTEVLIVMWERMVSFYTFTRSYFSQTHNLLVSLYYLIYPFAFIGIFFVSNRNTTDEAKKNFTKGLRYFCIVSIFSLTLVTAFTYDEWSARFQVPMLLFVVILAARGVVISIDYFRQLITKRSLHVS